MAMTARDLAQIAASAAAIAGGTWLAVIAFRAAWRAVIDYTVPDGLVIAP
jgi:hypothetical protein